MECLLTKKQEVLIIKPQSTRIDILDSTDFKSKFNDYLSQGYRQFILNLSNVTFIDSAGLGALISAGKLIVKHNGQLVLCEVSASLGKIFSLVRLDLLFPQFADEQAAIASLLPHASSETPSLHTPALSAHAIEAGSSLALLQDSQTLELFKEFCKLNSCKITFVNNPKEILSSLQNLNYVPEIIFVEEHFVDTPMQGIEVIQTIKKYYPATPFKFALLLHEDDLQQSVEASREGVQFLLKLPLSITTLEQLFPARVSKERKLYKILVIDDDEDICRFIKEILKDLEIEIRTVTNEKKLLDCLYEFQPNLLLLDINLPTYDGWSLLKMIRSDVRYKNLKVIIISTSETIDSLDRQAVKNYDDAWPKPLNPLLMLNNVRSFMEESSPELSTSPFTFLSQTAFEENLQSLLNFLHFQEDPLSLLIIGCPSYQKIANHSAGAHEEYKIYCENLFNSLIPGKSLRGYLEEGKFAFLFPSSSPQNMHELVDEILVKSQDKIFLEGIFPVQFCAKIQFFSPMEGNAREILAHALQAYQQEAAKLEVRS